MLPPNKSEDCTTKQGPQGDDTVRLRDMLTLGVGLLQQNEVMQCIELLDVLRRSADNVSIRIELVDQRCIRSSSVKAAQHCINTGVDNDLDNGEAAKIWAQRVQDPKQIVGAAQIVPATDTDEGHPAAQPRPGAVNPAPGPPGKSPSQRGTLSKESTERIRRSLNTQEKFQDQNLPWLPDKSNGGLVQRCFILFEDASASWCGKMVAIFVMSVICLSTVSFMMETIPEYRQTPDECAERRAGGLEPTVEACEPKPNAVFHQLEVVCIAIFTVEYLARVLSVHSVTDSVAGTAGGEHTENHSTTSGWARTFNYAKRPLNVIDFMAIIPFYIELLIGGGGGGGKMAVIRVLRLARIFRIFKMGKSSSGMQMLAEVLVMSSNALQLLMFFNFIIMIVFGSLLYHVEGREFSVAPQFTQPVEDDCGVVTDAQHPTGVFVREVDVGVYDVTPFRNIPVAMWWVCTTMTTVGYGDMSPSTDIGKAIGVALFYVGIIMLALPIAVLGANFEMVYRLYNENKKSKKNSQEQGDTSKDICLTRQETTFRCSPWFPECEGLAKRIFLIFEDATASKVGQMISLVVISAILTSTWSFVFESMEEFSTTSDKCVLENLTKEDCEPQPHRAFGNIDVACIIAFTVDYLFRILLVHTAEPKDCGIEADLSESRHKGLRLTWLYFIQKMNLLDLAAIAPFYVQLLQGGGGGSGGFAVLRVLRLIRVFRVLRMKKLRSGVEMLLRVIGDSLPALSFLFFMSMLSCVLFSSCMYFAEGTSFSVDHFRDDYPEGLYLRPTIDGHGVEPSPFRSIPYAFWWFFQTATTVGYGDLVPTTTGGRLVGLFSFYAGMILLSLPVTILGGNFTRHYYKWTQELQLFKELRQKQMNDLKTGKTEILT